MAPILIASPESSGPPSMGTPAPLKRRPKRASPIDGLHLPIQEMSLDRLSKFPRVLKDLQGDLIPIDAQN